MTQDKCLRNCLCLAAFAFNKRSQLRFVRFSRFPAFPRAWAHCSEQKLHRCGSVCCRELDLWEESETLKDWQEDSLSRQGCGCWALPRAGVMALAWEPLARRVGFKAGTASLCFDPSRLQLLAELLLLALALASLPSRLALVPSVCVTCTATYTFFFPFGAAPATVVGPKETLVQHLLTGKVQPGSAGDGRGSLPSLVTSTLR